MDMLNGKRVLVGQQAKGYEGREGTVVDVQTGAAGRPQLLILFDNGEMEFIDYRMLTIKMSPVKGD